MVAATSFTAPLPALFLTTSERSAAVAGHAGQLCEGSMHEAIAMTATAATARAFRMVMHGHHRNLGASSIHVIPAACARAVQPNTSRPDMNVTLESVIPATRVTARRGIQEPFSGLAGQ
jgi:hypothetical protein